MNYYPLDLQITKDSDGFINKYKVSIRENEEIKCTSSFELQRSLRLIQMLDQIEEKAITSHPQHEETVHIELGKILYNAIFSDEVGDFFNKRFYEVQQTKSGLRVSLQFSQDIPEIANLPWEYLHNGEDFLILNRTTLFTRLPIGVKKTKSQPLDSILRMLVIISGPDDPRISSLNTQKEQEMILRAVNNIQKEKKMRIDFTEDATYENVESYLNEQNYHIVHFIGHGINIEGKGHLVFETEDRKAMLINNKTLANLFSNKGIRLVVLSSCQSAKGSNKESFSDLASVLSQEGIPAVVAMQYSLRDEVAIKFAYHFYSTIVSDEPIDIALNIARNAIKKSKKSNGLDFGTPVMYLSDHECIKIGNTKPEHLDLEFKPVEFTDLQVMKTGFIARKKELRILERCFRSDSKRVAIIHGLGGMGKTVLATRFAFQMSEHFDGVFGMKFTSTTRPENILTKINSFLVMKGRSELNQIIYQHNSTINPSSLEEKTILLVDVLDQQHFLIIFDNLEACLDEDKKQIKDSDLKKFLLYLLNNCIKTKFIITTRYDFDFLEDRLSDSTEHISLPELQFPQTVWMMNNYKELRDLDIRKKKLIYDVVGGHPWTIGQFSKLISTQEFKGILNDLKSLQRNAIGFTLLDKSFSTLDNEAKKLLIYASIYKESVPIEALSWIMGDSNKANPSVTEPLEKLIHWGFISKEQIHFQNVYSEYAIVKDFTKKKLAEEGIDEKTLLIRAARYYKDRAEKTRHINDILNARDYFFQAEDWTSASEIVEKTKNSLICWGYIELAMNLLMESIKTTSGTMKLNAEETLANILCMTGNINLALEKYKEVKSEYVRMGDSQGVAVTLHALGIAYNEQGKREEALQAYHQSLKIAKEIGYNDGFPETILGLGNIYLDLHKYEKAAKFYDLSLKITDELGNARIKAGSLNGLANVHYLQGNYKEAIKLYNQSLKIEEELGNKSGIAGTLHQLGLINCDQGNYEDAIKLHNESLKMKEELGEKSKIASSLLSLGNIHLIQENYNEALKMYTQSLKLGEEIGDRSIIADSLFSFANINYLQNNFKEAIRLSNQILKMNEEVGDKSNISSTLHLLGMIYHDKGNYEDAIKLYNQSLKISEELGDKRGIAITLHQLGNLHQEQGNYEDAVKFYNQSLKIGKELRDKSGFAQTIHALGITYELQGNYEEAVNKYDHSMILKKDLGENKEIAEILIRIGTIRQKQGKYEEAIKLIKDSLKIVQELEYKDGVAISSYKLGKIYHGLGEYEEAIKMYNISLKSAEDLGYKKEIAKILHQIGLIYQDQEEYEKAIKLYNQSLEIKEELGDKRVIGMSLQELGAIYQDMEKYEEAIKMYNKSLKIAEDLGYKKGIAEILHQIGLIYQDQEEYEKAIKLYNQSLEIKEELGDKSGMAYSLHQLGIIYQDNGKYEEAIKLYNQSLKITESLEIENGTAATLHALGMIYQEKRNYEEAIKLYNRSLRIRNKLEDKQGMSATLHALGMIYHEQRNYEEAIRIYRQIQKISK